MLIRTRRQRVIVISLLLLATLGDWGCVFWDVKRQQAKKAAVSIVAGHVSTVEPSDAPLVVTLFRLDPPDFEDESLVDHFVLERPGWYFFKVAPGTYALGAFHDLNRDLNYDPDEPAKPARETIITLAAGETRKDVELEISPEGRVRVDGPVDIRALQARSAREQMHVSLGQLSVEGELADLSAPRFGAENGRMGLWRPYDFLLNVGAGIYFAEPYDPDRTPVLFVHGISGYPAEFSFLSKQLDRERFQPWFYYYPSGSSLDHVSAHLSSLVVRLRVRHDFDDLYVVAHSMGGLVARSFILKHYESTQAEYVSRFVSISTPWNGHQSAQRGVDRSPVVVSSWRDVAPDSAFINEMFYENPETWEQPRPLPGHLDFHLLFGFKRSSRSLGRSSDGVVTVASQLRPGAQRQADTVRGFDQDHAGILRAADTAGWLNQLLESD